MTALAVAPLGLKAIEMASSASSSQTSTPPAQPPLEPEKPETASTIEARKCMNLLFAAPYVAEVRFAPEGQLDLRQWLVRSVQNRPQWNVASIDGADQNGWREEPNADALGFNPPLATEINQKGARFLVTAPTAPANYGEVQQLSSFAVVFGSAVGTYQWQQRQYQYAVAKELPCFAAAEPSPVSESRP